MKFRYASFQQKDGSIVYRPTIPVTMSLGKVSIPIADAIVDTGADQTLLPLALAISFGFSFDLKKDGEDWAGAGGGKFRVFPSRKSIEFVLRQDGFRDIKWSGPVIFTVDQLTILLGHKGCLEYLDLTFKGKQKMLEVHPA